MRSDGRALGISPLSFIINSKLGLMPPKVVLDCILLFLNESRRSGADWAVAVTCLPAYVIDLLALEISNSDLECVLGSTINPGALLMVS